MSKGIGYEHLFQNKVGVCLEVFEAITVITKLAPTTHIPLAFSNFYILIGIFGLLHKASKSIKRTDLVTYSNTANNPKWDSKQ